MVRGDRGKQDVEVPEHLVIAGYVARPQALKGRFRVAPQVDDFDLFAPGEEILIGPTGAEVNTYELERVEKRSRLLILKVRGVETAEQAEALRGQSVFLEKADLPDAYFDAIVSTSTLEHIPQPYHHIKEIIRILKPGGVAYFAGIPNYESLSIKLNMSKFNSNKPPMHVNYFSYQSMCQLFSKPEISGKIIKFSIKSYGIPELHRLYHSLQRLFNIEFVNQNEPTSSINSVRSNNNFKFMIKKILALTSIMGNYHLGRLFHTGDKLEIIAIKQ